MKRFLPLLILAAASILLAQAPTQATLRTPTGDRQVTVTHVEGLTLFAADEVIAGLGGAVSPDGTGFKANLNNTMAAFGPDSRFGVVRDELIEMPVAPAVVDGRPYLPLQFFQGYLSKAGDLEVLWDPAARVLTVRPTQHTVIGVALSVANVQGISKVVITLSGPADYAIVKEQTAYTIHFKTQIRAPFATQAYDDPYVAMATFSGADLRLDLKTPDAGADAYKLENPFRIVLDFHKVAPIPGALPMVIVPSKPVESPGIHTIVIDPGHGGKEVGAIGPDGLMEKDATLTLCRKLADNLETRLRTRVILTRTDDSVVPLDQRTAIANQYKADLFLSVHMNAAVVKGAHGSETYFLSLEASDELAKKAAEVENAAVIPAGGADLKLILWDLAQQAYVKESSRFAQAVQEEMNRATGVQNRGVKQAPFKVLVGATMPAALVEVAFITNPEEEVKLRSDAFQKLMVDALTTAIERYKVDYETRIGVIRTPPPVAADKRAGTE